MKSSLLKILQYLTSYVTANGQLKRLVYESIDHQNIIGESDDFPVLFISLENVIHNNNMITYNLRFRISDLLQNDRSNLKFLHSELALQMNDIFVWLKENTTFTIQAPMNSRVISNDTTESTVTVEAFANISISSYNDCLIPFTNPPDVLVDPCTPINPRGYLTCEDLEFCQTIIDINDEISGIGASILDLEEQIANIATFSCADLDDCEVINDLISDVGKFEEYISELFTEIDGLKNDKNEYFIDFRSTSPESFTIGTGSEDIKHKATTVTVNRTANGLEITSTGTNIGWVKFNKWKWLRGSNRSIEIIVQKHTSAEYVQLGIGGVNTNEVSTAQWNGFAELAIQYRQNDIANLISNNGTPGSIQTQAVSTSIASNNFLKFRIETDGGRRSRVRVFAINAADDWYNNSTPILDTLGTFNMNPDESELCIWMTPVKTVVQTIVAARIYEGADLMSIPTPISSLAGLSDVSLTGLTAGEALIYDGVDWTNTAIPAPSLVNLTDVNISGATAGEALLYNGTDWVNGPVATSSEGTITYAFDGFGGVIVPGYLYNYLVVPFNCTINNWTIVSDISGNIEIDIWRANNAIPTVANTIVAANYPNLTAQQINSDATLTSWTTSLVAGDVLFFNVNSATLVTNATIVLKITK